MSVDITNSMFERSELFSSLAADSGQDVAAAFFVHASGVYRIEVTTEAISGESDSPAPLYIDPKSLAGSGLIEHMNSRYFDPTSPDIEALAAHLEGPLELDEEAA